VVTVDRDGDVTFYVDSETVYRESIAKYNGANISNSNQKLLVGAWVYGWLFNGQIDSVKILKQLLNQQEVEELSADLDAETTEEESDETTDEDSDMLSLKLPFTEDGFTAWDISGNGNDGTCVDHCVISDGVFSGNREGLLNCGNDSSLDMGTSDFTISLKVRLYSEQDDYVGLITKGGGSNSDIGYALVYASQSQSLLLSISDGNNRGWYATPRLNIQEGQYYNIAVTVDRDNVVTFYIDGQAVYTENISSFNGKNISNSSRDLLLGSWLNSCRINGSIDDAIIYKKCLTASEINNL
jgi:hypothetical protein